MSGDGGGVMWGRIVFDGAGQARRHLRRVQKKHPFWKWGRSI